VAITLLVLALITFAVAIDIGRTGDREPRPTERSVRRLRPRSRDDAALTSTGEIVIDIDLDRRT